MAIKAYKGFNKDMTCRGFQFEEGKEYEEERAELCRSGFHACDRPLDVFGYYAPAESVYHEVELEEVDKKHDGNDSKVCAKKIKVGASIDVKGLIKAQFEYVKSHCTNEDTDPKKANAGDCGAANAGYCGAANAGYCGAANAGDFGAANAGYKGAANAGYKGAANAGDFGAANAGYKGAANAGDFGAAISRGTAEIGKGGVAVARGEAENKNRVRGKMGAILVIALEKEDSYEIESWKAGIVDGETLKPDTWYKLENGEFVEANED